MLGQFQEFRTEPLHASVEHSGSSSPCSCSEKQEEVETRSVFLCTFVNQMVSFAFDLKPENLQSPDRGCAKVARARQVSIYLMNTSLGHSFVEIAKFYRRDRTTVSHACRVVEELRDRPNFESRMEELEGILNTVITLSKSTVGG